MKIYLGKRFFFIVNTSSVIAPGNSNNVQTIFRETIFRLIILSHAVVFDRGQTWWSVGGNSGL